jgi:anti-sigma regulatory factor (Ser/Thr protein kinase)
VLDAEQNRFVFSSAGHSPTLIRRADGTLESLPGRGAPLGISRRRNSPPLYEDQVVALEPGDKLVLYTDGVTEAMHHARPEQFGTERFEEVLRSEGERPAREWIERQFTMLDAWSGDHRRFDDETLVVLERSAAVPEAEITPIAPRLVALAELRGLHLDLPCDLRELSSLADWIKTLPDLEEMADPPALLATAVYEVCANIVEHGTKDAGWHVSTPGTDAALRIVAHGTNGAGGLRIVESAMHEANAAAANHGMNHPRPSIDLWWVPALDPAEWLLLPRELVTPFFLVRDRGRSFSPLVTRRTDFASRATRRRGRGFGLDLVNRAMHHILYLADTTEGNLTVMMPAGERAFDRVAS